MELEKISAKVVGHANVTGARDVVPGNGETAVNGTGTIDGYTVDFLEGLDEVVIIFFAGIFDAKIIHYKGKSDGFGGIIPKGRGAGNGRKSELRKVRFEAIIGDAPGLFEAGHNLANLLVYPSVGAERLEVLLVNSLGRDASKCKVHIFLPSHISTVVEVLDVQSHKVSIGGGESAV